jgi:hypothetical protein
MRRTIFIGALLALLVMAVTATAGTKPVDRVHAAKDCRALKASMGRATFRATYGRAAMARCVRQMTREEADARVSAVQDCRAEREELGADAFREQYGNRNGRNAFGKCVAGKRRAEARADRADVRNAAKACKAERVEMGGDAFREAYGRNENDRNAFGKCVSGKARESDEETPTL